MSAQQFVDPRGPRFGAAVTVLVLALALVLGPVWGLIPLAIQTIAFALGAIGGLHLQPWGILYRSVVRPRLAAPTELEDPRPPRFAQAVGLGFAVVALVAGLVALAGVPALVWVFYIATAFAFIAAFLNAAFDFCLGCEMWVLLQRLRKVDTGPRRTPSAA